MKRSRTWIGLSLALLLGGSGLAQALIPADEVVELLSGISFTPSKSNIDLVLGSAAIEDLIEIAEDSSEEADIGLRIRAYRALGVYQDSDNKDLAIGSLREVLSVQSFTLSVNSGEELLYLRASMLSLAQLAQEDAVADLVALLGHSSRDIRSACAQALAITGSASAIQALRNQALVEEKTQVKLAIEDALFVLEQ